MKKRLLILIPLALVVAVAAVLFISAAGRSMPDGSSERARREFVAMLGYNCADGESSREIIIPAEFNDVYEQYNSLQKECGYDLSRYKGENATCYTYTLTDYPDPNGGFYKDININILVCGGKIIGGDISSAELDGFMEGLKSRG